MRTALLLALLVCAALGVRLIHFSDDPIWYDEAATIGIAAMPWNVILGPMAEAESSPPGYYAIARLWTSVLGDSIEAFRMLSVLAGVGAILPVFFLARRAFGGAAAWAAVGFLAFAATHVRFSQDARCYAVLFLVAALAMLAAARLADRAADRAGVAGPAVVLGLLMGLSLWIHPTAAFIVTSLNVFVLALLVLGARSWRVGVVALAGADLLAGLIALLPLMAMLAHVGAGAGYVDRWIVPPDLLGTLRLYGRTLVAPFLGPAGPIALVLQLALLAMAGLAWRRTRNPMLPALAAFLATGALLLPLASQFRPVLLDRTALFLLLPLALLLGAGAAHLPRPGRMVAIAILLALQVAGVAGWHMWPVRKEQWNEAARILKERMQPGEPIVLADSSFLSISLSRHLARIGAPAPTYVAVIPTSPLERIAAQHVLPDHLTEAGQLCGALDGRTTSVWLALRPHPEPVAVDESFTTRMAVRAVLTNAGGRLLDEFHLPGAELQHWSVGACRRRG